MPRGDMTTAQQKRYLGKWRGPARFKLIGERDRELILEFITSLGVLSERRRQKYRVYLGKIGYDLGKPFEQASRKDLLDYLNAVSASEEFSPDTKRDVRLIAKRFFKWMRDDEFVKGIRLGTVDVVVRPEDILTDAELGALRNAAKGNIRNEALLETLYEMGPRPQEFLVLRKTDVVFDEYGARVTIPKGKTGGRTVRLVAAAPLLANWVENHSLRARDAPLWVDNFHHRDEPLRRAGLQEILEVLARKAGIEKRLTPYLFRHTRATHLAKVLPEAQLCSFMGWKIGSEMPRRYIHFSLRDVDEAILKIHGVKKPEQLAEVRAPSRCVRCGLVNPPEAATCSKCGMALTLAAAMAKDERLERLEKNQEELFRWLRGGAKVDPAMLNLRSEDLPRSGPTTT